MKILVDFARRESWFKGQYRGLGGQGRVLGCQCRVLGSHGRIWGGGGAGSGFEVGAWDRVLRLWSGIEFYQKKNSTRKKILQEKTNST